MQGKVLHGGGLGTTPPRKLEVNPRRRLQFYLGRRHHTNYAFSGERVDASQSSLSNLDYE